MVWTWNDSNASFQHIMTELAVDRSKPVDQKIETMWSRMSKSEAEEILARTMEMK